MYFVYILECGDGSLYTGITTDPKRRLAEHQAGKGGHFTSSREVVGMVFIEEHPNRSSALKREAEIKSWKREKKILLIESSRKS